MFEEETLVLVDGAEEVEFEVVTGDTGDVLLPEGELEVTTPELKGGEYGVHE